MGMPDKNRMGNVERWGRYLLLAAVALSWVISLVRKIRGILLRRREDKMLELIMLNRMREAQMYGEPEPDGGYKIRVDDLFDDN